MLRYRFPDGAANVSMTVSRFDGPRPRGRVRFAILDGSVVPHRAPLYRRLADDPRLDFTAIFSSTGGIDPVELGHGEAVQWDVDLISGYRAKFLRRAASNPTSGKKTWEVRDWDIAAEVARGHYEVLAMSGYNSLTYLMAAATQRAMGRQLLFREEQTLLEPRRLLPTLLKEPALRLMFRQGRALWISRENRRWFEHYGVPIDRLFWAPYTVDNAELQSTAARLAPSRRALRTSFGISGDTGPVILTVSRLAPRKQPLFLLEAYARARERAPCTLLVVGSGEVETQMRTMVRSKMIPDVVFAGFVNRTRIGEAYAAADVFALLPRAHETFGQVVPEAMNFGLPIVVSEKVGCAADLVSNEWNGFVVSAHDPAQAAQAFERLVRDPATREAMGAASLKRINSWQLQDTVDGILEATAAAVGARRWAAAELPS